MKVVLQRVTNAHVSVQGDRIGEIARGVMLLVGFGRGDRNTDLERAAERIMNLRVFPDDNDRLQHSLIETGFSVLAVPQFTLYARTNKGRRPDFTDAMVPGEAKLKFDEFVDALKQSGCPRVQTGRFGADMAVSLVNDGPLTLQLEF